MKSQEKIKMIWSRVKKGTPYSKMADIDESSVIDINIKKPESENKENGDTKLPESESPKTQVPKKEKKKRKGWKRIRHIALVTCRYIGVGVSHMSPMPMYPYSYSEYAADPNMWYNSTGKNYPYNSRAEQQYFLAAGMLFTGW